jgi:hypothetical protein
MGTSGVWREVTLGLSQKRDPGGMLRDIVSEPVLLNVYGSLKLIPRNEFFQPM